MRARRVWFPIPPPHIRRYRERRGADCGGQIHMYEAAAMLWTARRASGRAIARLPLDPEWDNAGIRMELVR